MSETKTAQKFGVIVALLVLPHFAEAKVVTVQVKGMVCAFCAQGIEKKFKALPETEKVNVSLENKKVEISLKEAKDIADPTISKIITDSGYEVVKIERAE